MPWYGVNLRSSLALFVVLALGGVFTACTHTAYAVDTEIGAVVCGNDAPGAAIEISQPINDSVVNQPTVTFRGTVNNTAQIEVFIDGSRDRTLAIGANQTSFQTDVTITEGTRTVEIVASDICNGQDASDSVAITYQPIAQPSSGGMTPTSVDAAQDQSGAAATDTPIRDDPTVRTIEQLPVIGAAVGIISDFASSIGLESTVFGGSVPITTGAARVGLTVAAVSSLVMASSLAPVAAHAIPGVSEVFHTGSHRSMIYLEWVIRGIGVLAMSLAYFL